MASRWEKEYQEIIRRLKQARLKAGLTQADVARKLGRPQSFVSKIESGERRLDVGEFKLLAALYPDPISDYFE